MTAAPTAARVPSGAPNVDLVLGGGLLENAINLIIGPPGAGKTILAQQYLFNNATKERPGIYLTTVSEPLERILRYGQTLGFFDQKAVGSSVFYQDLGATMNERGLPGVLSDVDGLLKERRPGMVVIDSFKALHPYADNQGDFRRFLHDLAARLSVLPVTSFWVGEYGRDDATQAPEFAVADAIVSIHTARTAERDRRVLQVLKLRGSGFMSGQHAYRLSSAGFEVFPRLADAVDISSYEIARQRMSSGIPILDEMLTDGYWTGASTLVAGPLRLRQDFDGPSFRLCRGTPGGTQPDRHVPGEPGATGVHLPGVRVVSSPRQRRGHVPHSSGRVHRRVGPRPARYR